jgi:hypothetical protein
MSENEIERIFRDSRINLIVEGANEVMQSYMFGYGGKQLAEMMLGVKNALLKDPDESLGSYLVKALRNTFRFDIMARAIPLGIEVFLGIRPSLKRLAKVKSPELAPHAERLAMLTREHSHQFKVLSKRYDIKMLDRQAAIISSMTKLERKKPDVLQASRKRRIAAGAGVDVAEVNRLLKQHRQMADTFKAMSRDGGKGFARMAQMMGGGGAGGMDRLKSLGGGKMAQPDPAQMEELAKQLVGGASGLPGLGGAKLPGLGGLPPGFNPFKKS